MAKVTVMIFLGSLVTAELRMHLNTSIKWKHANILHLADPAKLALIHFQGQDYIGCYRNNSALTLTQLKALEQQIQVTLRTYCPDLETEKMETFVFPQVLIA